MRKIEFGVKGEPEMQPDRYASLGKLRGKFAEECFVGGRRNSGEKLTTEVGESRPPEARGRLLIHRSGLGVEKRREKIGRRSIHADQKADRAMDCLRISRGGVRFRNVSAWKRRYLIRHETPSSEIEVSRAKVGTLHAEIGKNVEEPASERSGRREIVEDLGHGGREPEVPGTSTDRRREKKALGLCPVAQAPPSA